MAARYWVGGTATWDATAGTKWALTSGGAGGQAAPTSADDVYFDGASGTGACTVANGQNCKTLTTTGYGGTFISGSFGSIYAYGNVTLHSAFSCSGSPLTINFKAAGTFTQNSTSTINLEIYNSSAATLTIGSNIDIAGPLTIGDTSSITATNRLMFVGGELKLLYDTSGTANFSGSTVFTYGGMYFNGAAGTFTAPSLLYSYNYLGCGSGAYTFNDVVAMVDGAYDINTSGGTPTFANLTLNPVASNPTLNISVASITVTGVLTANGYSATNYMSIRRSSASAMPFSAGSVNLSHVLFYYIDANGAAIPWTGYGLQNGGGNVDISYSNAVARRTPWFHSTDC